MHGYIIDPQTLEYLESTHHERQMNVLSLVDKIAGIMGNDKLDLEKQIERRAVSGFVYVQVPGFNTPIVRLYFGMKEMGNRVAENDIEKIIEFIKQERKLLPISGDFQVL